MVQEWWFCNSCHPLNVQNMWHHQAEWVTYWARYKMSLRYGWKRVNRAFKNWKPHVNTTFLLQSYVKLLIWQNCQIQMELHTIIWCILRTIFPTFISLCFQNKGRLQLEIWVARTFSFGQRSLLWPWKMKSMNRGTLKNVDKCWEKVSAPKSGQ